jgi:Kelch motif
MSWEVCKVAGTNPFPRNYHTGALYSGKIYVFGGIADKKLFNALHILNTGITNWVHKDTVQFFVYTTFILFSFLFLFFIAFHLHFLHRVANVRHSWP